MIRRSSNFSFGRSSALFRCVLAGGRRRLRLARGHVRDRELVSRIVPQAAGRRGRSVTFPPRSCGERENARRVGGAHRAAGSARSANGSARVLRGRRQRGSRKARRARLGRCVGRQRFAAPAGARLLARALLSTRLLRARRRSTFPRVGARDPIAPKISVGSRARAHFRGRGRKRSGGPRSGSGLLDGPNSGSSAMNCSFCCGPSANAT